MEEFKQVLRDMVHDPKFWIAVVGAVNLLYTWFVPVKYIALLQYLDTVIILFSSYVTARAVVRAFRARRAEAMKPKPLIGRIGKTQEPEDLVIEE